MKQHANIVDGKAGRVREIAKICYLACDEAVAITEFLGATRAPEVQSAFKGNALLVPALVCKAMAQRLLMSIMRMHDKPGSNRETLLCAFEILEDGEVFTSVRGRGDEARLNAAVARWEVMKDDPTFAEMRSVRNYELAHNIPSMMAGKTNPSMVNFFRVARQTIKLVDDLAAGTGVASVTLDHAARQIWAKRATDYWRRLADPRD